jgi:hypothetical protein
VQKRFHDGAAESREEVWGVREQGKILSTHQAKKLKPWVESSAEKMGQSAICMNIFTDDFGKDVQSLIQFSLAIILDKPIYLLVPQGRKIPELVRKVASGIEFYVPENQESLHAATHRLLAQAKEKGFSA